MIRKTLTFALWIVISLGGAFSLAFIAWSRSEPVNALWLVIAALCTFAIAYRFHSKWLMTKILVLNEARATPAYVKEDGRDFVKTNSWVVFGHHFAAIAGPGPLVGPVLASQFGYLPGFLWILIGATLGGAVHDSIILFASVRRNGKSLGQMVRDEISPFAGFITLIAVLSILIILIAVLALVVVNALGESPWGVFTVTMTIPIALIMGGALRYVCPNRIGWVTAFGVVALLLSVWGGQFIYQVPWLNQLFSLQKTSLAWTIIVYGFAASTLPVWLLLAPRDYLSTFMKIGTVVVLAGAILILAPRLQMPALTPFINGTGPVFAGAVFPFCFITIACGAVSGFHSLIASGTTPKMITSESCIRTIGYGAMIVEMLVAVMALIAACAMEPGIYFAINMKGEIATVIAKINVAGYPVTADQMAGLAKDLGEKSMIGRTGGAPAFAVGMALMFADVLRSPALMALWYHFAIMFEALFILTTIDAGTRVGRFLTQDLMGRFAPAMPPRQSSLIASFLFVGAWGWFLYQGVIDPLGGINTFWPIFGIANQLLAVIALAFGTVLLVKMGKARYAWVSGVPLVWLTSVALTAGWQKIFSIDPRLGFLSQAAQLRTQIPLKFGPDRSHLEQILFSQYVNVAVTAFLMSLVLLILGACLRELYLLQAGKKQASLHESPFVPLEA